MTKIILLAFLFLAVSAHKLEHKQHPEAKLNTIEYCQYFNYPIEQHQIITADGYNLTFYRIQSKYSQIRSGLKPIFLQHGLLDASDTFILNDESLAPAFMLANRGYDIWIGNSRGNYKSRAHVRLNPDKDAKFWSFSFQEMAEYDLPAGFEYIYNVTKQPKIDYIGHSQGTMTMFAALSEHNPVIKKYLDHFIALGPVAYLQHQTSKVMKLLNKSGLDKWLQKRGINEFMTLNYAFTPFGRIFCARFSLVCKMIVGAIQSGDPSLDSDRYDVLVQRSPGGTSVQNIIHFKQMMNTTFQKYDYGKEGNIAKYGTPKPPIWDLSKVDVPVYMFSGNVDLLADPIDVNLLKNALTGSPKVWLKEINAGHLTFMWGKNMQHMGDVFAILENRI